MKNEPAFAQVEMNGKMRRSLSVLKMCGSMHGKDIWEFILNQQGTHIGRPFRDVAGILAGNLRQIRTSEIDRLIGLFSDDS